MAVAISACLFPAGKRAMAMAVLKAFLDGVPHPEIAESELDELVQVLVDNGIKVCSVRCVSGSCTAVLLEASSHLIHVSVDDIVVFKLGGIPTSWAKFLRKASAASAVRERSRCDSEVACLVDHHGLLAIAPQVSRGCSSADCSKSSQCC